MKRFIKFYHKDKDNIKMINQSDKGFELVILSDVLLKNILDNPLPSPTPTPTPHHDEEETVPDNPTPTPTTAEALTAEQIAQEAPTPTPYINPLVKLFPHLDRNGDHKIEITEVYEVVKTWVTGWRAGETKDCDINNDGVCNLIDLSITLYYINR